MLEKKFPKTLSEPVRIIIFTLDEAIPAGVVFSANLYIFDALVE
jgi:hypothetical protein